MFDKGNFMDCMGYRNMLQEEKIEECLREARRGERCISVDRGDLTDSEVKYVKREVKKRIQNGRY